MEQVQESADVSDSSISSIEQESKAGEADLISLDDGLESAGGKDTVISLERTGDNQEMSGMMEGGHSAMPDAVEGGETSGDEAMR